jgi:GT2 family glycosyltransferase
MLFSIIIPTCNRNDLLSKCLDCLHSNVQVASNFSFEVIVTDDSKNCEAKQLIETCYPWVIWLGGPRRGPASNRNYGASKAKGEWLVFIDDDCLPKVNLLEQYNKCIESNIDIKVFEGKIEAEGERVSPIQFAPLNMEGGYLWSCNFVIEKKLFDAIGGFDENFKFPHMEDTDLRVRLIQLQHAFKFASNACVVHPWRKFDSGYKLGRYQEMYVYYQYKHRELVPLPTLLFRILRFHIHFLRRSAFSSESFTALKILLQHLFTVSINYRKWNNKYRYQFKVAQ